MTAEKEKPPVDDKLFIQTATVQVMEALANVGEFKELTHKGLKSMTHKQFIMLLQHFIKPIVGNVQLDGTNYLEYIYNLLSTIEYPYTINKGSLKTPSAPHCQNGIIILLAWLSEFSGGEAKAKVAYIATEDFTTSDTTNAYMAKVAESFKLWNNQQEAESEELQEEIRQMYIEQKIGSGGNIHHELNRLRSSIEQLQKEVKPVSRKDDFNKLREESNRLKVQQQELLKSNQKLSGKIEMLNVELESKQAAEHVVAQELGALRKTLSNQKMTLDGKNEILKEISQLGTLLAQTKEATMKLTEDGTRNEVELSNLILRKFSLIDRLNNSIYKLSSEMEIAGMREEFNPAAYVIKTKKVGDSKDFDAELEQMSRGLSTLAQKYQNTISFIEQSQMKLEAEKQQLGKEAEVVEKERMKLKEKLETLSAEESELDNELRQLRRAYDDAEQNHEAERKQVAEGIATLEQNIADFNKSNALIVEKKASFKQKSIVTCRKFYEDRKKEVEENREKMNKMKAFLAEFNKTDKPFEPDVQKTIDEVMAKRAKKEQEKAEGDHA